MVAPSQRREMAQWAVKDRSATIKLACQAFGISQTCYRYKAKLDAENGLIADWLVRLTNHPRNWGFGLCFLYLRNVKGFRWNHKRVYRIYRELELNLRIKPRHRLVREKPLPLAVPTAINQSWWTQYPSVQCDRRLQPQRLGNRGRLLAAVRARNTRARPDHRMARQAGRHSLR